MDRSWIKLDDRFCQTFKEGARAFLRATYQYVDTLDRITSQSFDLIDNQNVRD